MAIQLIGAGVTVNFEASPWAILESGIDVPNPPTRGIIGADSQAQPGTSHTVHKLEDRTLQLRLRLSGANVDALQTEIRKVDKILQLAAIQQSGRHGYPQDFVGSLDCYLDYQPSNLSAGGRFRIIRGVLDKDSSFYSGFFWRNKYILATLTLLCWPHLVAAAWVQGSQAATAFSAMPFSIAAGATGGNDGSDRAPIRLGIRNPAATTYNTLYGAVYPDLGTPIKSNDGIGTGCLVDSGGATEDAPRYNGLIYRTNIDSTSYEQVGSLAITTDAKPRRYLVIIKRRTSVVTNLNWRITVGASGVVSPIWKDNSTPNNTWGAFVAGQFTFPHREFTGTTDADGLPNTFNGTFQLQAAKQAAGDATADVDTDFVVFIPMDLGAYFVAEPESAAVWVTANYDYLHIYNDDGIARIDLAKGAGGKGGPGELVDSISVNYASFSGGLPVFYPGANKVILVALRSADGNIFETDTLAMKWTIRKRYISL